MLADGEHTAQTAHQSAAREAVGQDSGPDIFQRHQSRTHKHLPQAVGKIADGAGAGEAERLSLKAGDGAAVVLVGADEAALTGHGLGAVSYTHLDVYKRQGGHFRRRKGRAVGQGDACGKAGLHLFRQRGVDDDGVCLLYTSRCV